MNFNLGRSLKFKITIIFVILMAIAFTLNWMVALQTMRSEKVNDIQKILNHVLNESYNDYLSSPLTPESNLSLLYAVPHNQMILNNSEVSNLRFKISHHFPISKNDEIISLLPQSNGYNIYAISDTQKIDTTLNQYAKKLFVRYCLSLLVILFVSILLLNYYMKPLSVLAAKIHHWQSGDPFDFSLDNPSNEIREVSSSFSALIRRLEMYRVKESQLFKEAAHELKTPLALMRSRLDVYENTDNYPKNKFITDLGHDIERLTTELKNVLFLESSDFDDPVNVNIHSALTKILHKVEILAQRKNLDLQLPQETFFVTVSEKLLNKVLMALIENAMTYAKERSIISIDIDSKRRTLCVKNAIGDKKYLFSSKIGEKMLKRLSQDLFFTYEIVQDHMDYTISLNFLQPDSNYGIIHEKE